VQDGQVLLVRHTYGDRLRWELPGGGVKRRERAPDAARREIREELGIELGELRGLGDLFERIDGRRDRLCCFSVEIGAVGLELDRAEIADARWFRPDRLPERRARYVARIVGLALAPLARLP
jgi:8-oxo-dGTP pyrophosphatase MutT (NUDIX family)